LRDIMTERYSAHRMVLYDLERDGLHRHLGGAIPKGSLMVILGEVGSGKSAVLERLIYGMLLHNHTITMVSTEMTTKEFINQMDSLDYPIKRFILTRALRYVPVFPLFGKSKPRGDFLRRVMETEGLYKTEVTAFDTFSALVKHDINEDTALQTISFFKKIVGRNKLVILTIDPNDMREELLAPFKNVADILIELKRELVEGIMEHIMYVTRFSHAPGPINTTIGFRIEAGAGFIVDITHVA